MWWKIYFWIYIVISVIGVIGLTQLISNFAFGDWIGFAQSILLVIGLYSYLFNKKVFSKKVWMIIYWVTVISWVQTLLDVFVLSGMIENLLPFLKMNTPITTTDAVISIAISIPALLAIYRLGSKK